MAIGGRGAHIGLFIPSLDGGGAQRVFLNLAAGLIQRGHRVELLLCRDEGAFCSAVPREAAVTGLAAEPRWRARLRPLAAEPGAWPDLLRPVLVNPSPGQKLPYLRALADHLRAHRPDCLLSANPQANLVALWACRIAQTPTRVVVSEHNTLSVKLNHPANRRKWRWRYLVPLLRRTYSQASAVVAVSAGVADDLAETAGLPRPRIATLPNPIVPPDVERRAAEPVEHPWFASGGPPILLAVGRLHDQKDFPTLLNAFARLRRRRPARLVILGEGPRRHGLKGLVGRLGIAGDVAFPGWVDNPYRYLARASVFVLSSAWEGLSNVLVEALACGCPVVSTDCPSGPSEILHGGRYGRLVPVGDPTALAQAIEQALAETPDRVALRRRAADYAIDRVSERYEAVLLGADAPAARNSPSAAPAPATASSTSR